MRKKPRKPQYHVKVVQGFQIGGRRKKRKQQLQLKKQNSDQFKSPTSKAATSPNTDSDDIPTKPVINGGPSHKLTAP